MHKILAFDSVAYKFLYSLYSLVKDISCITLFFE